VKYLFDAIEARFEDYPALVLRGRQLYVGFEEVPVNATKPYTELNARLVERLDTFASDIEVWDLDFRYHADALRTVDGDDWIDGMTTVFKDADIKSGVFTTAGCRMTRAEAPMLTDGLYDATIQFQLIVQRKQELPLGVSVPEVPTGATTVVFALTKDLRIESGSPSTNFNEDWLHAGRSSGSARRFLLHYDLSSIPAGSTVSSATLDGVSTLELTPTAPAKVKRLTTTTWGETTATWNTSDGVTAWSPANSASPQTGPYTEVDAVAVNLPRGGLVAPTAFPFSIPGLAALAQDAIDNRAGQLHLIVMTNNDSTPSAHAEFYDREEIVTVGALPFSLTVVYA
jgi:hypothetical protein